MELIVIMGPQAVGKMTVGQTLEKRRDAKLLYNHQTLDLYANFLGYGKEAFRLSDETRLNLFQTFVENKTNVVSGIIFTVLVAFDNEEDMVFLEKIKTIFEEADGKVYFVELEASLEKRLERNVGESRLQAKPSKRDIKFSRNELLTSMKKYRLNSLPGQMEKRFPNTPYLRIDNTDLSADEVADKVQVFIENHENSVR